MPNFSERECNTRTRKGQSSTTKQSNSSPFSAADQLDFYHDKHPACSEAGNHSDLAR